jgi:bifunctional non-homologous end joining protein LigD
MEVTNPEKVLFPDDGITKGDLVGYYETAAPLMVPHAKGRPLTLERYPNGIGEQGFFQKNAADYFPESIGRVLVPKEDGTVEHPVVNDGEGLVYLANQGTVSFHVWTSRSPTLDRPDRMIFDLDPPEGDVVAARWAARRVGEILDELRLGGLPMTTGSKGYHVVVPLVPEATIEQVGETARAIAAALAVRHQDRLTTEFRIAKREGRVFIDWLRNRYAQSGVCPWSVRPKARAPVAVPLTWEELGRSRPDRWRLGTIGPRLSEGDPWADIDRLAVPLGAALESVAGMTAG